MSKGLKKNIIMGISGVVLAVMVVCSSSITTKACEVVAAESTTQNNGVTPRSAIIEWRFKAENGKIYRRLYNYTEQCWVGDWILCE